MLRPTPGDPWGVEQHHWNTGAEENQQLNPGEPNKPIAPKVVAPLATGALSGLASTGVSKIFGNGLIFPVPPAKQQELLNKARALLNQCANQSNVEKQ